MNIPSIKKQLKTNSENNPALWINKRSAARLLGLSVHTLKTYPHVGASQIFAEVQIRYTLVS